MRWVHEQVGRDKARDLVGCSDASMREEGRWGVGWLVADREERCLIAMGWIGGETHMPVVRTSTDWR